MLSEGTNLKRGYSVERVLGQGGMGTVYLARQTALGDRPVALKEIHLGADSPESQAQLVELFKREARILATLDHPGIVEVLDFFEEDGVHYLSMNYISGSSLQELCSHGPLPLEKVYDWADQICEILDWLHQRQPPVIVRDLKPSNLLLTPEGRIRLIDFGIAGVKDSQARTATVLKGAGTVGYAPVEQFGMKAGTDARADIYALGATLYSLLTGEVPPFSLDLATGDAELIPPRDLNPAVSDELEATVMRMMALKREHRYQSAREVRERLQSIRQHANPATHSSATTPPPENPDPGPPSVPPPGGNPLYRLGAAAIVMCLFWGALGPKIGKPPADGQPTRSPTPSAPTPSAPTPLAQTQLPAPTAQPLSALDEAFLALYQAFGLGSRRVPGFENWQNATSREVQAWLDVFPLKRVTSRQDEIQGAGYQMLRVGYQEGVRFDYTFSMDRLDWVDMYFPSPNLSPPATPFFKALVSRRGQPDRFNRGTEEADGKRRSEEYIWEVGHDAISYSLESNRGDLVCNAHVQVGSSRSFVNDNN